MDPIMRQEILEALASALRLASDNGVLDDLAAYVHPDTINAFVDAVTEMVANSPYQPLDADEYNPHPPD